MATRANYRQRLRKSIRDWPKQDALGAAIASTTVTTITVTEAALYEKGGVIRVDSEEMLVLNIGVSTIEVIRGWYGTTAATHSNGAMVYIFNMFSDEELNRMIEEAIRGLWPDIYADGLDETTTLVSTTYTYDIPSGISSVEGIVADIHYYTSSEARGTPMPYDIWGSKIYLPYSYDGTARIFYVYPYAVPSDDSTDLGIPSQFDNLILTEAEVEAYTSMLIDRSKYEKFVTSQWRDNVTGYELESHLDQIADKAEAMRDRLRMAPPSQRRWA